MSVNQAKFTINATPSEDPTTGDRLYQATVLEVLTLTLEVNPSSVLRATYYVYDPTVPDSPLASMSAPLLTFAGSGSSSDSPTSPNGSVTVQMPAAAAHSYNIRCVVSTVSGPEEFVRQAAVPYTLGAQHIAKTTPEETIEFFARTWSDKFNQYLDYIALFTLVGLDDAYDKGGAGLGYFITADINPVTITVPDTSNNAGMLITQSDVTNNPNALEVSNAGTGNAIELQGAGNRHIVSDGNMSLLLTANAAGNHWLKIVSSNAGAGAAHIDIDADENIDIDSRSGHISLDGTTASNFSVTGAAVNLSIEAIGGGAQVLAINSAGTGVNAIDLNATAGGVTVDAAKGISIDAALTSNLSVSTSANHLTIECYGGGAQKLFLNSAGTGVDAIDMTATAGGIEIDAVKASHFIVSGGTADLTFNARAGTAITLNETGQVALDAIFTATSVIGALNELKNGPLWMSFIAVNAATYTVNAGDEYAILHVTRTTAGTCAITIQTAWIAIDGNTIWIKDTGRNSLANNITILTQGAELFEGDAAGGVMKSDGACWGIQAYNGNLYMIT